MKKKISVAALLLSLLLALAVPVQAKSEEETVFSYDAENHVVYCDSFGLSYDFDNWTLSNAEYISKEGYKSLLYCNSTFSVSEFEAGSSTNVCLVLYPENFSLSFDNAWGGNYGYLFATLNGNGLLEEYPDIKIFTLYMDINVISESGSYNLSAGNYRNPNLSKNCYVHGINNDAKVFYAEENLYCFDSENYVNTSVLFYEGLKYNFENWCSDVGLSCSASSNESAAVIPYSYNDYWHIVRRSSSGKWLLTTIGNSKKQQDMQLRISEDNGNLIIYNTYSGDGTDSSSNGYLAHVRQYEYVTDGWKLLSYSTYDFRELGDFVFELEAGTGFDDTKILAYTNTDIYSFNGYAIMHAASTEFIDNPIITITPTPTTSPGSSGGGQPGSGSRPGSGTASGGQATGGGGLDFIINLFTLIWTKICSIPMAVDGYSISLQQLFVYGALVSIIGGFIMHFIFGRK